MSENGRLELGDDPLEQELQADADRIRSEASGEAEAIEVAPDELHRDSDPQRTDVIATIFNAREAGRISAPGIYSGVPMEVYLSDPVVVPSLSASIAVTILQKSPMHAWANHARNPKRAARDDSKEADIGTVAHQMLLEGCEDCLVEIDPEDHAGPRGGIPKGWTNDSIKAARDAARAAGKTPMLKKYAQQCRDMAAAAHEYVVHSEIAGLFKRCEAEATVVAQEGAIWTRCRPDLIANDRSALVHLKTTARSAKPSAFGRGLLRTMGYDVTLAFYARCVQSSTGTAPLQNVILAQEQDYPYACSLIAMAQEYEDLAFRMVEMSIRTWEQCMRTNRWPGYSRRIEYIKPSPYLEMDVDEEEIKGFVGNVDPKQIEAGFPQA